MTKLPLKNCEKDFLNKDFDKSFGAAWSRISPNWPLQNVIACNPLQGFEDLKFQNALKEGFRFFQRGDIPQKLEIINQITIKRLSQIKLFVEFSAILIFLKRTYIWVRLPFKKIRITKTS